MNVVFLQEGYDPSPDANSICVKALVEEYKARGEKVYVVCDGRKGSEDRFSDDRSILHVPVEKQKYFSRASLLKKIPILLSRVASIPIWPIRFPKKVKGYVNLTEKLLRQLGTEDTVVISVYRPAEMVEAGYRLKKKFPQLKWVVYNLDGIETNVMMKNTQWFQNKERRWQFSRYSRADIVAQMETHRKAYLSSEFAALQEKTLFLDFPLVIENNAAVPVKREAGSPDQLLYAGSFYRGLREPFYMIEWFRALCQTQNLQYDIYTRHDFVQEIVAAGEQLEGRIQRHDYVSTEEMDVLVQNADYLVSVGNAGSRMVPSKIFVYLSTGKPIIHFVSDDDDSCLPYLNTYPEALIIDERLDVQQMAQKAQAFFDRHHMHAEKKMEFTQIREIYYKNTPVYTVDMLNQKLGEIG